MTASLRYPVVVFDLDGTLVDSYAALTNAVNHARTCQELPPLSSGRIRELVGDGVERLLQRAFDNADVPATVIAAFETRYDEVCCAESKVLADVEETLDTLAALGVSMGVCTNKPTTFSKKILDFLGLSKHFRSIVGPDIAGARKPDAQHLFATVESMSCDATDALMVGDMPVDVHTARNSGIDVAVIATGSSTREALAATRPDYFLDRLTELVRIVRTKAA